MPEHSAVPAEQVRSLFDRMFAAAKVLDHLVHSLSTLLQYREQAGELSENDVQTNVRLGEIEVVFGPDILACQDVPELIARMTASLEQDIVAGLDDLYDAVGTLRASLAVTAGAPIEESSEGHGRDPA